MPTHHTGRLPQPPRSRTISLRRRPLRLGNWTFSAGLRWDHYQLLLNQNAFSPRVSVGRYLSFARHGASCLLRPHLSDAVLRKHPDFQFSQIDALSDEFLRLPVRPSLAITTKVALPKPCQPAALDVNVYRRDVRNFADDDQLLNTGVSYPIAFDKAVIYGAEGKISLVRLGNLTGYLSYSYMVGNVWFPVTGGLFLGDDVDDAINDQHGHIPNSQDQRNTVRTRFQYQLKPRLWVAAGVESG